jgi:lysophospholipase L1-like esterase
MPPKRKSIIIVAVAILVVALSLTVVFSANPASTHVNENLARVACLGDSITEITGYPELLQSFLGNNSVVGNFGVSGATVNLHSNKPYYYETIFQIDARSFRPTTVVIMLGTNDARTDTYQKNINFTANYERMINRTQHWNNTEQVFLVIPPPIFNNILDLNGTSFAEGVIPHIRKVATEMGLTLIDVYTPLKDHPEYFPDGVHPDMEGAQIIADIIYKAIK